MARCTGRPRRSRPVGVFGVPTVIADGELYRGVDGLNLLDASFEHRDPVPADIFARREALPVSATRRT